jgi:hypothetical protein
VKLVLADAVDEGHLHLHAQEGSQLIREVSAWGVKNEFFRGGQQSAESGKPDLRLGPQSAVVETGDFAQGIVSAAMGVAAEVIQRLEFAEDRDID